MPVDLVKVQPESYQALVASTKAAETALENAGLDAKLRELIAVRVSQVNGCAFCLRMHVRAAIEAGETSDRLAVLPAWRESQYFSPQEEAALALAERITTPQAPARHGGEGGSEDALDEAQTAAAAWYAIIMNTWNRTILTSGYPVAP